MCTMSAELMRCGVCLEHFNSNDRKPKFLQCYHTYCSQCLTNIQTKKKTTDGGGVEFQCPSCRRKTNVGNKGVEVLQDNFYLMPAISCKDVYQSDDEDDIETTALQAWCNTCLDFAAPTCSQHDICNLDQGKKFLYERLQTSLKQATEHLTDEIKAIEPRIAYLNATHSALEDQLNRLNIDLTIARSEMESMTSFKQLTYSDDTTVLVSALKSIQTLETGVLSRRDCTNKQTSLLTILQSCHIEICSHGNQDEILTLDITGSDSSEKALAFLMSMKLERNKESCWSEVVNRRKSRSHLFLRAAVSTESLPASISVKTLRCYFEIAVKGVNRGRVVFELRPDVAPKMCTNFKALCTGEHGFGYRGSKIFKAVRNDHIVGGDFEHNDGTGGHSIYNKGYFAADNVPLQDEPGTIRMKGMGKHDTTGSGLVGSQFLVWVGDREFKNYSRTLVIGRVVQGLQICKDISNMKTFKNIKGTYIILNDVVIQKCGIM